MWEVTFNIMLALKQLCTSPPDAATLVNFDTLPRHDLTHRRSVKIWGKKCLSEWNFNDQILKSKNQIYQSRNHHWMNSVTMFLSAWKLEYIFWKIHAPLRRTPPCRCHFGMVLHGPPLFFKGSPFHFQRGGLRPHLCLEDEFSSFYRQNSNKILSTIFKIFRLRRAKRSLRLAISYFLTLNFRKFSPAAGWRYT
jgi:hypothetical protein